MENIHTAKSITSKDLNTVNQFLSKKTLKKTDKKESIKSILTMVKEKDSDAKKSKITEKLSIDCEMVEINSKFNGLARISIVNYYGEVIFDSNVKPIGEITNYRSEITGIYEADIQKGMDYSECRKIIMRLIKNRIIIGHSLENDFMVLNYEHPKKLTRDTSKFKFFQSNINLPYSLKYLTKNHLDFDIQETHHDSIDDARAALCLYRLFEEDIEKDILNKNHKLIRKRIVEDAIKVNKLFGK